MMVVIGIIAILGAVVVPGVKKAYGDFMVKEFCYLIDRMVSACRSFYLVFNELPASDGSTYEYVKDVRFKPFILGGLGYKAILHGSSIYYELCVWRSTRSYHYMRIGSSGRERPYYWDDFENVCRQKGYTVEFDYTNGAWYWDKVHLPLQYDVKWFR